MKIPNSILQFAFSLLLKNVGNIVETPMEKIPHIDVIAKAWVSGEPLEVIVGLYLQATESLADDEVAGKIAEVMEFLNVEVPKILGNVSSVPAKQVAEQLLGGLTVPDFNEDPSDNTRVISIINDVFNQLAN